MQLIIVNFPFLSRKKHQQILAKSLQKYLIDLYIFPTDIPPETLPTLEELKYKFIVKCGGKRLYENIDIPLKNINEEEEKIKLKGAIVKKMIIEDNFEDVSDSEEDIESENIDEFYKNEQNNICVNRKKVILKTNDENEISKKNDIIVENLEINMEINDNNENKNFALRAKPNNNLIQKMKSGVIYKRQGTNRSRT